jgi:hypothetical protein
MMGLELLRCPSPSMPCGRDGSLGKGPDSGNAGDGGCCRSFGDGAVLGQRCPGTEPVCGLRIPAPIALKDRLAENPTILQAITPGVGLGALRRGGSCGSVHKHGEGLPFCVGLI